MPEPLLTASAMFANAARFSDAYHAALSPLCAETGLPPAAADILLFLANNPGCETAGIALVLDTKFIKSFFYQPHKFQRYSVLCLQ